MGSKMKLFSAFFAFGAAQNGRREFHGDKVFRLTVENELQLKFFEQLSDDFDVWKEPKFLGDHADVHVRREMADFIEMRMASNRINYDVMIDNVEQLVSEQFENAAGPYTDLRNFDYQKYHTFDDYQSWQSDYVQANSDLIELIDYGTSYEGRALNVMKIGNGSKTIVLHGGTHAREWITPITMINMTRKLVEGYRAGGADKKYLDDITWHIVININPDGYNYTWTSQRMWRKTRADNTPTTCVGVDPNRNWNRAWATVGSSNNPCSDTYHGPSAFSEIEMKKASEYIEDLGFVEGYADVHAYSQYWMYPYGYASTVIQNRVAVHAMSNNIADAIKAVHNKSFAVGSIWNVIYPAAGSSADWAYDDAGVPCSFALELRDQGQYGFLLPENQIKPVEEEMWAGFTVWADAVIAGTCDSK